MRTVREKDPTYFGMTAHSGADEYVMRASIDRDIATLKLSGVDDTIIVYLIDNLDDGFKITTTDSFCTKAYVTQRANIADIAFEKGISETEVLQRIIKTITNIVDFLKELQGHYTQEI